MESKLTIDKYGTKEWRLPSGELHRENGPAVEWSNGDTSWWIKGVSYTEQQYKYETRSVKLKLLL
jgi:hypothetical protein